jgi:NAD(P)-dependent dehydrogenase (short-subunit alcohol dehydrogenase family)
VTRTICVTGSASGIGAAVRGRLEADGLTVIGVDRSDAEVIGDLADPIERRRMIDEVTDRCDRVLDGFVPCAGVAGEVTTEALLRINYFAVVEFTNALLPALRAGERPSIVMITSNSATTTAMADEQEALTILRGEEDDIVALYDRPGAYMYPSAKLALAWWMRERAASLAGEGIRINAVAPGITDTPMTRGFGDTLNLLLDRVPIPIGHRGDPAVVAESVVFLLSDLSSHTIGQVLTVDGGTDVLLGPLNQPRPLDPATENRGLSNDA